MSLPEGVQQVLQGAIACALNNWSQDWKPDTISAAPGRIELLGNHLDYNGGPVLAAAIDRYAVAASRQNDISSHTIEIVFCDTDHSTVVTIDPSSLGDWRNENPQQEPTHYAMGVAAAILAKGLSIQPGQITIKSTVPVGVGVSSSASLCIALCQAMLIDQVPSQELVLLAQEAEHRAGTPCGTMDQSAEIAGDVIYFNGADLSVRTIEPDLGSSSFLVIDSGVRRSLNASSYGKRVEECAATLARANTALSMNYQYLAQIGTNSFPRLESAWAGDDDPTSLKRARHVISETGRVARGERALLSGNWSQFGMLMTASGRSSALDYAISHPVVERLVRDLTPLPGVLGARMMGGGEGGSVLALVDRSISPDIVDRVTQVVTSGNYGTPETDPVYEVAFASGAFSTRITP